MSVAELFRSNKSQTAGKLDSNALDQLFREARTHNGWLPIARAARAPRRSRRPAKARADRRQCLATSRRFRSSAKRERRA